MNTWASFFPDLEALYPLMVCGGLVFAFVPLALCLVALAQIGNLRREVAQLREQLRQAVRELLLLRGPETTTPARVPPMSHLEDLRRAVNVTAPPGAAAPARAPAVPVVPVAPVVPAAPPIKSVEPESPPVIATPPVISAAAAPHAASAASATPAVTTSAAAESTPSGVIPFAFESSSPPPPAPLPPEPAAPAAPALPRSHRPDRRGFEAFVGTRLYVVLGAIALVVAAILMVRFAYQQRWVTPERRVLGAIVAGVALLALGQWRRKKEAFLAQGLSAAGIGVLYAGFVAGTIAHHYPWLAGALADHPLWPKPVGFAALACVTALAVVLSLQQGPFIAVLGLVGGFLTPILIRTDAPNVPGLFGYLLLLHVGLLAAARWRGWIILAALSVVASSLWLLGWAAFAQWDPQHGPILGVFMLASAFSLVATTARRGGGAAGAGVTMLIWTATGLALASACVLLGRSGFSNEEWGFFAVLLAGAFVLARLRGACEGLAWICSAAVLAMILAWAGPGHGYLTAAGDVVRLRFIVSAFGAACVLAAYGCQWGSPVPLRWGLLTASLAIFYVLAAYFVVPAAPRADEWAYLPLAAAGVLGGLAVPVYRQRASLRTGEATLAGYALGVLMLLALSPPMALHGGPLTAAWSALLVLAALGATRLRIEPLLFGLVGVFFLLAWRCLALPAVFSYPPGPHLLWNPIVWAYGSVLVAMLLAMALLEWTPSAADERPDARQRGAAGLSPKLLASLSALLQVGAAVAGFLLVTMEIRRHFHSLGLREGDILLTEQGTYSMAWLLLACALIWMGQRLERLAVLWSGVVLGAAGLGYTLAVSVVINNPLWPGSGPLVGQTPVFNVLLYVYGVPAGLAAALALVLRRGGAARDEWSRCLGRIAQVVSVLLLFVLLTLEVRQWFRGESLRIIPGNMAAWLGMSETAFAELGTYPLAWLALAVGCVWLGQRCKALALTWSGDILTCLGILYVVLVCVINNNPLFVRTPVGEGHVWNLLLYVYGTATLLCLSLGLLQRRGDAVERGLAFISQSAALLFLVVLATLEVRHGFHHTDGGLICTGDTMLAERGTYTIAWLLVAGACLGLGDRRRGVVAPVAGCILTVGALAYEGIVCVLAANPLWGDPVGTIPVWNLVLYVYGAPAALAAGIAWLLAHGPRPRPHLGRGVQVCAVILASVAVGLEVRQGFHGEYLYKGLPTFVETATYPVAWLALAGLLLAAGYRFAQQVLIKSGYTLALLSLFWVLLISTVTGSPLIWHDPVGSWRIVNWVLYAWGVPLLFAWVLAHVAWAREKELDGKVLGYVSAIVALLLLFVLVSMEVRQFYNGAYLNAPAHDRSYAEMVTYSLAWAALGSLLLVAGILRRSVMLRTASAVLIFVTVFKVFIFDVARLTDLVRVLSVAGLGVTLIALAFVYHKFVFGQFGARQDEKVEEEVARR